jgi:hypothetical protein
MNINHVGLHDELLCNLLYQLYVYNWIKQVK